MKKEEEEEEVKEVRELEVKEEEEWDLNIGDILGVIIGDHHNGVGVLIGVEIGVKNIIDLEDIVVIIMILIWDMEIMDMVIMIMKIKVIQIKIMKLKNKEV
jgi:hypothetical protein